MISTLGNGPKSALIIDRGRMLLLLETSLQVKAFRFSRQAALAWLSSFPGDLEVEHYYAKALISEGRSSQAQQVLEKILKVDPLYLEANQTLLRLVAGTEKKIGFKTSGVIQALGGAPAGATEFPEWGHRLLLARQSIKDQNYAAARSLLSTELGMEEHPELVDILHLEITAKLEDTQAMLNLSRLYHMRWPDCVQISQFLAKAWMDSGNEDEAVKLLHLCAAKDVIGQVPTRMWGENHPYKRIYPSKFEITVDFGIPAEVSGKLGLNQLSAGELTEQKKSPEQSSPIRSFDNYLLVPTRQEVYPDHPKVIPHIPKPKDASLGEVQMELNKLADKIKQPALTHADDRFPAYVILTTRTGLEAQYGIQSAQVVISELKKLAKVVEEKKQWSSILFLPDDLETCGKYGVTPISAIDPWMIKLALVDLDNTLQKSGERIGSVLIVGGEEVVPFHKLPNPTDDNDAEVPSDNPYGSLDSNYFIADWPVGRLPGEDGSDAGLLLTQIRNAIRYQENDARTNSIFSQLMSSIMFWNKPWILRFTNLGYTASIWRRSSLAVFRPIGEARNLYLSPESSQTSFKVNKLANAPLAYFNLHGIEDGSEWYGQRDPVEKVPGPDFPVALSPADLRKNPSVPGIVFSEACYGGHIFGKNESQSIALTLMGMGVQGLIASTTVAYGSVSTPMIGADLLGYLVMKNLKSGLAIGPAFSKAKVEFVREMNRRQGYLDGEDQKTLISFVLYGDPLVAYDHQGAKNKAYSRDSLRPIVKTISDRTEIVTESYAGAPKMISQAKELVKEYLPGIEYAEVRITQQQVRQGKSFSTGSDGKKYQHPDRVVVSFSKQFSQAEKTHRQYARVTMDKQGKVIKLAISR